MPVCGRWRLPWRLRQMMWQLYGDYMAAIWQLYGSYMAALQTIMREAL